VSEEFQLRLYLIVIETVGLFVVLRFMLRWVWRTMKLAVEQYRVFFMTVEDITQDDTRRGSGKS
jgi:hypothetical protein